MTELPRHLQDERDRQKRRILVVEAKDRFYLRLPGFCPGVVEAIKALVPYERRHPKDGLGWMALEKCWAFSYDDYHDIFKILDQLMPKAAAEVVDEMPEVDRSKPLEGI